MTAPYNEETVEKLSLEWLADLGYDGAFGPDLDESGQRGSVKEVVLESRLREAVRRINPDVPAALRDEAVRRRH